MDAREARQHLALIDEILWELWDPIGVNDVPAARSEYSAYTAGIYRLLRAGASDGDLMRHLASIETDRMGLSGPPPNSRQPLVKALRAAVQPNPGLQGTPSCP